MDRLSILLTLMSGAVLTGGFVTIALSFGFYAWPAIALCAVLGFALSWPTAYAISRLTKRNDPNWDHTRAERTDTVPRPAEAEV
jgi:hypothetical protein